MMKTRAIRLLCSAMSIASAAQAEDNTADPISATDIVVTADQLRQSVVAGKANIPLIETPQAISVIPQDLIRARGITRLADALRTVAGVSTSSTYGFYDAYTIRGYDAAYGSVYLDGLISEAGVGINQELFGLEQIEVVKGPASMLFGQAPLGGLVNLVSKRPQDKTFLDLTASTGSYHLGEGTIDANTPLNKDGTLLARVSLLYRDAGSFVRNAGQNRLFVAPALTWKIAPDTSLSILARYERDHDNPFSPLPAYGTVLANPATGKRLPDDFGINGSGDQKVTNNRNRKQIGYVFDHRFGDALSFSQTLRYTHRTESWDKWMFASGFIDADGNSTSEPTAILGRMYYGPYHATDEDLAVDSRFNGTLSTGPIVHEFMTGLDYRQNRETYFSGGDFDATHNPLDLDDPDYSSPLANDHSYATPGSTRSHQTGVYLQDHMKLGDRFTLTVGGRYDWAEADGQKDHAFSPRIGATATILPGASLYASWSKSFVPQIGYQTVQGVNADGSLILANAPPERGENYEVGLKFAAPSSRLSGMISLFQLTRQNVANSDPVYVDYYIVTGEQRSRGIEIEGQWRPVAGLSLNLAYSYIHAKITEDNVTPVGTPLQNVPRHNLGLFAQYIVPQGSLKDLGASFGVTYNSRRNGSLSDFRNDGSPLLWLPAYTLFDAGISYRIQGWGIQANVANLFDKHYFPDACCLDRVTPGQPRSWRLTLSRSF